jgi:hypothetical protein
MSSTSGLGRAAGFGAPASVAGAPPSAASLNAASLNGTLGTQLAGSTTATGAQIQANMRDLHGGTPEQINDCDFTGACKPTSSNVWLGGAAGSNH